VIERSREGARATVGKPTKDSERNSKHHYNDPDVNADLEHLIRLQQIDSRIDAGRRRIADIPILQEALAARLAAQREAVDGARAALAASQSARREIEKEVAAVQSRLSKYKDQLMEVKTNKEYQAMQKEIATAQEAVREQEDKILDRMEEQETLTRQLHDAEAELKRQEAEIAKERQVLEGEAAALAAEIEQLDASRADVARGLSRPALQLFEHVARQRKGLAIAEARDGHCMVCHVRLRPQVFNEVRRNDHLIQCESCLRILYFAPASQAGAASHAS
jgi:predicted  nucleic acid-binding Zn-ribbon protein